MSDQARRGLRKFGVEPTAEFESIRGQLASFRDVYLDVAGSVTASSETPLPVYEEIDQLFAFVTTATADDIATEEAGPREDLYAALRVSCCVDKGSRPNAIDSAHVQGKHIGQVLGELYVDELDNGDTGPAR